MIKSVQKQNETLGNFNHYKVILQDDTILIVPLDEANTDYQNILKWVADGNTIQEAD